MTPEEAAKFANVTNLEPEKVQEFLLTACPRDIQKFLHSTGINGYPRLIEFSRIALDIRLSEDAERTAQKLVAGTDKLVQYSEELTQQTERLVSETFKLTDLTRGLNRLTFILGVLAVVQIFIMLF